jgi:outer membrane protein assembly factor BamD (BamD/ComL family)
VTWMDESKREELTAFALYRLSLTYLLLGETGQAQLARDKLLTQHPEHIYAQVMGVLWDTYLMDDDLRKACEAVGSFAAAHPETAEVLAEYGYGNPTFTREEVCPITLF